MASINIAPVNRAKYTMAVGGAAAAAPQRNHLAEHGRIRTCRMAPAQETDKRAEHTPAVIRRIPMPKNRNVAVPMEVDTEPICESSMKFQDLNDHCQIEILSRLPVNEIMIMYRYIKDFDSVMKKALGIAARKPDSQRIRIHLSWTSDIFEKVLEILDVKIEKILIIGNGRVPTSLDRQNVSQVAKKCPNVWSLGLRNIPSQEFTRFCLDTFERTTNIDLKKAPFHSGSIEMPTIKEFTARVSVGMGCEKCQNRGFYDVSQDKLIKILRANLHFEVVRLIMVEYYSDCDCKDTDIITKLTPHVVAGSRIRILFTNLKGVIIHNVNNGRDNRLS